MKHIGPSHFDRLFIFEMRSFYVVQAGVEFKGSSDTPVSASQVPVTKAGTCHYAYLHCLEKLILFNLLTYY
jgi:hypothetical protein